MAKILCFVGLHRWRARPPVTGSQFTRCRRCSMPGIRRAAHTH